MTVEVKKDLRGRLAPGIYTMFVGAPVSTDGRSVETLTPSPIGVDGWIGASLVEGKWIVALDGLVTADATTPKQYRTRHGSYATEAEYEAGQRAAFAQCPRVDYLADDGRRADWLAGARLAGVGSGDAGP